MTLPFTLPGNYAATELHRWAPSLDDANNGTGTLGDLVGTQDGTLSGDAAWVPDTDAGGVRCLEFSGSGYTGHGSFNNPASSCTYMAWVKTASNVSGLSYVMAHQQSSSPGGRMLRFTTGTNNIQFETIGSSTENIAYAMSDPTVWFHVAAVLNTVGQEHVLYINGSEVAREPATANYSAQSLIPFMIGRFPNSTQFYLNGRVDDLRIFDDALNGAEVSEIYSKGRGELIQPEAQSYNELFGYGSHSADASLEVHWTLQDDPTGGTAADRSGNNRAGTIVGSPTQVAGPTTYLPNAMDFNGVDQAVWGETSVNLATGETMLGWVRSTTPANGVEIAHRSTAASTEYADIKAFDATTYRFRARYGSVRNVNVAVSDTTAWNFYVATGSSAGQELSANGNPKTGSVVTDPANVYDRFSVATGWRTGLGDTTDCTVAGAASFSRALTDAEIAQAYNGPEPYFSAAPSAPSAPTGTPQVGEVLTAQTDNIVDPNNGTITYTYQWVRADDNTGTGEEVITGETSATYTLVAADDQKYIACLITPSNDGGIDTAEANTRSVYTAQVGGAAPTYPPINLVPPVVSGTTEVGETLSCTEGTWYTDSVNFTVAQSGSNVGARAATHPSPYGTINSDVRGQPVWAVETQSDLFVFDYGDGGGQKLGGVNGIEVSTADGSLSETQGWWSPDEWYRSNWSAMQSYLTSEIGNTINLYIDAAVLTRTFAYQWQSGDAANGSDMQDIAGATSSTYLLTANESGKYIRCVVTCTNADGSTAENSNIVGPVTSPGPTFQPAWAVKTTYVR